MEALCFLCEKLTSFIWYNFIANDIYIWVNSIAHPWLLFFFIFFGYKEGSL